MADDGFTRCLGTGIYSLWGLKDLLHAAVFFISLTIKKAMHSGGLMSFGFMARCSLPVRPFCSWRL